MYCNVSNTHMMKIFSISVKILNFGHSVIGHAVQWLGMLSSDWGCGPVAGDVVQWLGMGSSDWGCGSVTGDAIQSLRMWSSDLGCGPVAEDAVQWLKCHPVTEDVVQWLGMWSSGWGCDPVTVMWSSGWGCSPYSGLCFCSGSFLASENCSRYLCVVDCTYDLCGFNKLAEVYKLCFI